MGVELQYNGVKSLKLLLAEELKWYVSRNKLAIETILKIITIQLPIIRAELAYNVFTHKGDFAGHEGWKDNEPSVIRKKGRNTPLIDTGSLLKMMSNPDTYRSATGNSAISSYNVNDQYFARAAVSISTKDTKSFQAMLSQYMNRERLDIDNVANSIFNSMYNNTYDIESKRSGYFNMLNADRPFLDIGRTGQEKKWIFDRLIEIIKKHIHGDIDAINNPIQPKIGTPQAYADAMRDARKETIKDDMRQRGRLWAKKYNAEKYDKVISNSTDEDKIRTEREDEIDLYYEPYLTLAGKKRISRAEFEKAFQRRKELSKNLKKEFLPEEFISNLAKFGVK